MTTNANQAYQRAANKAVDGALTMQQIDKQRELDRFWARQKPKKPVNEVQVLMTIEAASERLKWANSFERPLVLVELYALMSRQEWLKLLVKEWSGCDDCYRIKKELSSILDADLTEAMTTASEEAIAAWQSLPDELTVYRGCYKNNKNGLSWTFDKNIALRFPTLNRYRQKGQALLVTGKVKKTDGILFLEREESEILSSRVRVIGVEPLNADIGLSHGEANHV